MHSCTAATAASTATLLCDHPLQVLCRQQNTSQIQTILLWMNKTLSFASKVHVSARHVSARHAEQASKVQLYARHVQQAAEMTAVPVCVDNASIKACILYCFYQGSRTRLVWIKLNLQQTNRACTQYLLDDLCAKSHAAFLTCDRSYDARDTNHPLQV